MNITVTFAMPLPEGFEPFMDIIAKTHGWSVQSDISAAVYLCESVCKPQVSALFRVIVSNAISSYLGLSGQEQLNAILEQYDTLHTVTAEIE
jgi:hypothetical protein